MSFFGAIRRVYGNYANFSGRARRSEYWYSALFYLITYVAVMTVNIIAHSGEDSRMQTQAFVVLGIYGLFLLGSLVPSLAVAVRRMHDTNHSGWWLLLYGLPVIGGLILLIWKCTPGTPGPNKYGADPRQAAPTNPASVF